jgi:hypothetical protein
MSLHVDAVCAIKHGLKVRGVLNRENLGSPVPALQGPAVRFHPTIASAFVTDLTNPSTEGSKLSRDGTTLSFHLKWGFA